MFSNKIRKALILNRLARLEANGKDNFPIRKKLMRQLKTL